MLFEAFRLGGWRGERSFRAPADMVFAQLVAALQYLHFKIERADAAERGVVAHLWGPWGYFGRLPAGRFAASVNATGDGASAIAAEYSTSYSPNDGWQYRFRRGANRILDLVERALAE